MANVAQIWIDYEKYEAANNVLSFLLCVFDGC